MNIGVWLWLFCFKWSCLCIKVLMLALPWSQVHHFFPPTFSLGLPILLFCSLLFLQPLDLSSPEDHSYQPAQKSCCLSTWTPQCEKQTSPSSGISGFRKTHPLCTVDAQPLAAQDHWCSGTLSAADGPAVPNQGKLSAGLQIPPGKNRSAPAGIFCPLTNTLQTWSTMQRRHKQQVLPLYFAHAVHREGIT